MGEDIKIIKENGKILFVHIVKEYDINELNAFIEGFKTERDTTELQKVELLKEIEHLDSKVLAINEKIDEYKSYLDGNVVENKEHAKPETEQLALELNCSEETPSEDEEVKPIEEIKQVEETKPLERPVIRNIPPRTFRGRF